MHSEKWRIRGGGDLLCGALYAQICSAENLELAFLRARRRKTRKPYVVEFEQCLEDNFAVLRRELLAETYSPSPLKTFILRDPKTRRISKSEFRDRIVHHAICNVIEPIFDSRFIHDSYANRKGKGTLKAIKRFDQFKHKASRNFSRTCYVLKADIKHYFDSVDHEILLETLSAKIICPRTLCLIRRILENHRVSRRGKGMPLGNLTSQFFANVYLNELDQFVKHELKAKHYIRYVDDFVILHHDKEVLHEYLNSINKFLKVRLALELHPDKCSIKLLERGIGFLGFRIFEHHKLVRKKNLNRFRRRFEEYKHEYTKALIERERVILSIEGWMAYVKHANTYRYRRHVIRQLNMFFPLSQLVSHSSIQKQARRERASAASKLEFTVQKTAHLFRQKKSVAQIARQRGIKETTVWSHLANLIEYNQLGLWKVLSREKISAILPHIHSASDSLKAIKSRLEVETVSYDEIACALAYVVAKSERRNICELIEWYRHTYCKRKCYNNKVQLVSCKVKFARLASVKPDMPLTRTEFLHLFNNHIRICKLPDIEKRKYLTYREFRNRKAAQGEAPTKSL
ncbi:MAG: reverse transcriptase domain-containing protein [Candidatus Woesearchaeota archaeon]